MWVSCNIISEAQSIEPGSFRRFQSAEMNTRIARLDDRRIRVSVRAPSPCPAEEHIHNSHHVIKAVVLALNAGSLGYFYWENGPWAHPVLTVTDDLEGSKPRGVALINDPPPLDFGERRAFTDHDEYRTILLFGVFARGSAHVLENEYCRGLLLLRMQFCEIDFRRDSFMCFYRVLEHFVTRRALGVPKLQSELKQLQSCVRDLGLGEDVVAELKELYAIRSGQTAHAQNVQRSISGDEVLKLKVFVDVLLNKFLVDEGNSLMASRFGEPTAN